MYQALYRKWRPLTFADVVGQHHVTDTLKNELRAGRLSHAYLFTGTRGTGKTTCAKILARAVNCGQPNDADPCNVCPACRGILSGSVLDVIEMDAASYSGVDNIRALRDETVYTPAAVKKRVYIIDEVHMLSIGAFNALLTILEEPPPHVLFILATTEAHKVPATITSRCQQFAFSRLKPETISERLSQVAASEGLTLPAESAALLGRLADGSLRDGLSLLDQCASTGQGLSRDAVENALGLAGSEQTAVLLSHLLRSDTGAALGRFDALYAAGREPGGLLSELSAMLRLLLRAGYGLPEDVPEGLAGQPMGRLLGMLQVLQSARADLSRSPDPRLTAELCLVALGGENHLASQHQASFAKEAPPTGGGVFPTPAPPASVQSQSNQFDVQQERKTPTPAGAPSLPKEGKESAETTDNPFLRGMMEATPRPATKSTDPLDDLLAGNDGFIKVTE